MMPIISIKIWVKRLMPPIWASSKNNRSTLCRARACMWTKLIWKWLTIFSHPPPPHPLVHNSECRQWQLRMKRCVNITATWPQMAKDSRLLERAWSPLITAWKPYPAALTTTIHPLTWLAEGKLWRTSRVDSTSTIRLPLYKPVRTLILDTSIPSNNNNNRKTNKTRKQIPNLKKPLN